MSDIDEDEIALDLTNSDVVTKYKTAAEICNKVMAAVKAECKTGAKMVDIASMGDAMIEQECAKIFKGKKLDKGIAFPTCLSPDNCVGHYSPLAEDLTVLKEGSVLKIDLGAHIDGYIAVQATTLVVGAGETPVTGKAADAITCANTCFEAALRLIRPGKSISDVSGPLATIAEAYGCSIVEGVMTHNMKQFVIDGNKCVLNKPTPDSKVEDSEFLENEVYAIDIVVSTGEGKAKVLDEKMTTVYKRALDMTYNLKMKASRAILSDIQMRYPCMPFPLRNLLTAGSTSKFGMVECVGHGLLHAYPVLWEKDGEIVAHIKGTVLLLPNGSDRITTCPLQPCTSEKTVEDEEVKKLLATSIKSKKKKTNKKKSAAPADEAPSS